MASPKAARCTIREQLFVQFRTELDSYNQKFALLINAVGVDKASQQTKESYEACVASRKALQAHEREHRCLDRS
jgi:hypothetical protein